MPIEVTLTEDEIRRGGYAGVDRKAECKTLGARKRVHTETISDWDAEIEGILAEIAYCKAVGIPWVRTRMGAKDAPDGRQVRYACKESFGLAIRPDDSDTDEFVLVKGKCPTYRIVGMLRGREAKRPEWYYPNFGAYFIPQEYLRPVTRKECAV